MSTPIKIRSSIGSKLRYPLLTFLVIGYIMGAIVVFEYREVNEALLSRYEVEIGEQKSTIDKLSEENTKLKRHTKIVKIREVDGTVRETTEELVESERELRVELSSKMENKYKTEVIDLNKTWSEKYRKEVEGRKKLGVATGIDTNYVRYLSISYDFLPPFYMMGQANDRNVYTLSVGFRI